ncbi:MAG: caspase family protein [Rhizobiales bacterium]|nr:caspase family protein [Hyphomicrobiales bacterium]
MRRGGLVAWIAVVFVFCGWSAAGAAGDAKPLHGVALVIGQSKYENLPQLPNPSNDAREIDRLLSDLGFDVDSVADGDARRLRRAFDRFVEDAAGADVAFVYYSGHGVEAAGRNWLIPVDAATPGAGGTVDGLLPLDDVLERLQRVAPIVIVLLDACRTDPFPPGTLVDGGNGSAAPVAAAGLGEPRGAAPLREAGAETLGTVIGFAAPPGHAALDGPPGGNSPYAAAVLKHLPAGGYDFGDVMTMIAEEVYLKTGTRQLPWTNASLRRLLYFGLRPEKAEGDEQAIRDARRTLLLTISNTPARTRGLVEEVAAQNAVPLDALYGMLEVLGVDKSGPDLAQRLGEGAARLRAIVAERETRTRQDPEIVRLAALADEAEREGAMALALQFRDRASARADVIDAVLDKAEADIASRRAELASTYRSNAETAALNFDFATAARRYGDAYAQVAGRDVPLSYELKELQGEALNDQGVYGGDNEALLGSIAAYREALDIGRSLPNARRDAALKGNIAIVLTQLGSRTGDRSYLEQAIALNREVLKALPRGRYPGDWANAQLNLGALYAALAESEGSAALWRKALKAYESAQLIFTRDAAPEPWAGLQMNIGNAYSRLADYGGGAEERRRAVDAIEGALEVWTKAAHPVNWAMAQSNLASSLAAVGRAEKDAAMLRRAIEAQHAVLEVETRDRQPSSWAGDMTNLASFQMDLAAVENTTAPYREAIAALRAARDVFTRDASPINYALTLHNEGRALLALGRAGNDMDLLRQSEQALEQALAILAGQGNRVGWARTLSVQGEALAEIGRRSGDPALLKQARAAFEEARRTFRENGMGKTGQEFWTKQISAIDADLEAAAGGTAK